MSEERMIRVVMEDDKIVLGFLTIDKWGHTRVVDTELEPVAPKDWYPGCFADEEQCYKLKSCWNECPYRLR